MAAIRFLDARGGLGNDVSQLRFQPYGVLVSVTLLTKQSGTD